MATAAEPTAPRRELEVTLRPPREHGKIDRILPAVELRPYLVDAVERGMARYLTREHARGEAITEVVRWRGPGARP